MPRTASHTAEECEANIGPRGAAEITSANRQWVQKWLSARGVPSSTAKALSVRWLAQAYNDTTDESLATLTDRPRPAATPRQAQQEQPTMPLDAATAPEGAADAARKMAEAMSIIARMGSGQVDEARVRAIMDAHNSELLSEVEQRIAAIKPGVTRLELFQADKLVRELPPGLRHRLFPEVLAAVQCGNVALVGPAGSGKTMIAHQIAEAMGLPFYFNGAIASEYKLTGFIDAQGRVISTAFRKAYEGGGVYLFDEVDGSLPQALLAFNAALANGEMDFPDGTVKRHPQCHIIAAANTYGTGADRVYVGRNQLDGATLDRFIFIDFPYDEELERAIAGDDDWTAEVVRYRAAAARLKLRVVISPRASIMGAKLLKAGIARDRVREMVILRGMDRDTMAKLRNEAY